MPTLKIPPDAIIGLRQLGQVLGRSHGAIKQARTAKTLRIEPIAVLPGGQLIFDRRTVEAYAAAHPVRTGRPLKATLLSPSKPAVKNRGRRHGR